MAYSFYKLLKDLRQLTCFYFRFYCIPRFFVWIIVHITLNHVEVNFVVYFVTQYFASLSGLNGFQRTLLLIYLKKLKTFCYLSSFHAIISIKFLFHFRMKNEFVLSPTKPIINEFRSKFRCNYIYKQIFLVLIFRIKRIFNIY